MEAWGASGNCGQKTYITDYKCEHDVYGAFVSGNIKAKNKETFYLYIGGAGATKYNNSTIPGGWNGGGSAFGSNDDNNGSGGGASDVRLISGTNKESLSSRIMVAAGGAGKLGDKRADGTYIYSESPGGGLKSMDANENKFSEIFTVVAGATQVKAGYGKNGNSIVGSFGAGADGIDKVRAGGGGGWYGGGVASTLDFSTASDIIASGGSSYISGHAGSIAVKSSSDTTPKCTEGSTSIDCSKSWTGYVFTNTKMIDGAGYSWTTVKGSYVGQPQPDGSTAAGHNGNGYARITWLGDKI